MNKHDISKMAREAGMLVPGHRTDIEELERFAALVAKQSYLDGLNNGISSEREACAKVCDELAARDKLSNYYKVAANAIRARGNT